MKDERASDRGGRRFDPDSRFEAGDGDLPRSEAILVLSLLPAALALAAIAFLVIISLVA